MIPIMVVVLKFNIHKAVGTSTGLIIFTALGRVVSYIFTGWGVFAKISQHGTKIRMVV